MGVNLLLSRPAIVGFTMQSLDPVKIHEHGATTHAEPRPCAIFIFAIKANKDLQHISQNPISSDNTARVERNVQAVLFYNRVDHVKDNLQRSCFIHLIAY